MSDSDSQTFTAEDDKALHPYYKIETVLGEGNFGMVKKAIHLVTSEYVAIKIIEKENIVEQNDIDRIAREIMILKKLRHRNIIQLYEIIETNEKLYLILEYAEGGELYDYIIEKERLSENEAMLFYSQLLNAIEYIHSQNIAHRDLKPENILLDSSLTLKLIDFGLGNLYPPSHSLLTPCGSPCYASPEMIKGIPYSPIKSDIYSSGIVLFAMLTGYLPYEDANILKCSEKILEGKLIMPDHISKECGEFLGGVLKVEEEQRFDLPKIKKNLFFRQTAGVEGGAYEGVEEGVLIELEKLGLRGEEVERDVREGRRNNLTTCYFLHMKKMGRGMKRGKSKSFLEGGGGKVEKKARKMTVPAQIAKEKNLEKRPTEGHKEFPKNELERENMEDERRKIVKDELNSAKKKAKSNSVFAPAEDRTKEVTDKKRKTTYNTSNLKNEYENPIRFENKEKDSNQKRNTIHEPKEEEKLEDLIVQEEEIDLKKASPSREKSKSISNSKYIDEEQSGKRKRYTTYEKNTNDDTKFLVEIKNHKKSVQEQNHIPNQDSEKKDPERKRVTYANTKEIDKVHEYETVEEYPPDNLIQSQIITESMARKMNKSSSISFGSDEKKNLSDLKREAYANIIKEIEIKKMLEGERNEEQDNISIDNDLNSSQNSERGRPKKERSKAKSVFQNANNTSNTKARYSIKNSEFNSEFLTYNKDKDKVKVEEIINSQEKITSKNQNVPTIEAKKAKSNSVFAPAEDRTKEVTDKKRKTTYNTSNLKNEYENPIRFENKEKDSNQKRNTIHEPKEEEKLEDLIVQEEEIDLKKASPSREKSKSISNSKYIDEEQSGKRKRCTTYEKNTNDDTKFLVEIKNHKKSVQEHKDHTSQENLSEEQDDTEPGQNKIEKALKNKCKYEDFEDHASQMQNKKNSNFQDKDQYFESDSSKIKMKTKQNEEQDERNEEQDANPKQFKKSRGKSNSISTSAFSNEKESLNKRRLTTIQKEENEFKKINKQANIIDYEEYYEPKNEEESIDLEQEEISPEKEADNQADIRKEMRTTREKSKSIAYNDDDNKQIEPAQKRYTTFEKNIVVETSALKRSEEKEAVKENNSSSRASKNRSHSISASPDSNLSENINHKKRYTTYEKGHKINEANMINVEYEKNNKNSNMINSEARKQSLLEQKGREENLEVEARSDKKDQNRQKSKSILHNSEKIDNQISKKRYTTIDNNILKEFEKSTFSNSKEEDKEQGAKKSELSQKPKDKELDQNNQESDEENEKVSQKMINKTKSKSIAFSSTDAKMEELKIQKKRLTTYEKVKFEANSDPKQMDFIPKNEPFNDNKFKHQINDIKNVSEEKNKEVLKEKVKSRTKSNSIQVSDVKNASIIQMAKRNTTFAKPAQNFEKEELKVLQETKNDEREDKPKKPREKSKSIVTISNSNVTDRTECKPRKTMQSEFEYKNKEISKNKSNEFKVDHDKIDDSQETNDLNERKVNFDGNCEEYIRTDKKRVTKAAFNRPIELEEDYEEEEDDHIEDEDENYEQKADEDSRKVNFESSVSGVRKEKKQKTKANFARPVELDEDEEELEETNNADQRKVNFNSDARGEAKPKKRVTMANFKKYEDSEEEEKINNELDQDYQEEEEPIQRKVNFNSDARGEPKPKKRVTMANFKKYEDSEEEQLINNDPNQDHEEEETNQRKVNFDSEVRGDPKPKKRVTMANFTKYEDSDEENQQSLFEAREQPLIDIEKDDDIEESQAKSRISSLRKKDKKEKKKAVGFSDNVQQTKSKPKQRLTMANFKKPSELDEEDNEEIERLIRNHEDLGESQDYDDTETEITTVINDESTIGKKREEESMKNIDFQDKTETRKAKERTQSVRLDNSKHMDKNKNEQIAQKRKTFTTNDSKDFNYERIPLPFMQSSPSKLSEDSKIEAIDKNLDSLSDLEEISIKQQHHPKTTNRAKSNSVRMEKPDPLPQEKRKTFAVNSGQYENMKENNNLRKYEDENLSEGGNSDLENEVYSSNDDNEENFGKEEKEKEIKEKNIIKQRGKYQSLVQPINKENLAEEKKRKTLANTNNKLINEYEGDNKNESDNKNDSSEEQVINQEHSVDNSEDNFEFESSNEKYNPKFKSLFFKQNDSIELAKKRQSLNVTATNKPSKFKQETRDVEQSSEEKHQVENEEKEEGKKIKNRNKSSSVFLPKNEETKNEPNKNSRKTCMLNAESTDKKIIFELRNDGNSSSKKTKDEQLEKKISQPQEKQESQNLEIIEKEQTDSSKKARNKSSSVIITSVDLQNLKPSSTSRKTVAIFRNNENDKFKDYLNNINEKSLDFEEIKKHKANDLKKEEEELNYLENNIDPIQPKRKIFNKAHSVFISEKDHKSISQNLNGRKTIATSNVSSKTFEEEKLNHHMQNTRNYKEEENDSSQEREVANDTRKESTFTDEKAMNPNPEKQLDNSSQKNNSRKKPKHLEKVYNILKKNRMSYETLRKTVENPLYNEKEISELSKSIISNNRSNNINSNHKSNIFSNLNETERVGNNEFIQFSIKKNRKESYGILLEILDKLELDYEQINEHEINVLFDSEFEIEIVLKNNGQAEQFSTCYLTKLLGDHDRYLKFCEDLQFLIN